MRNIRISNIFLASLIFFSLFSTQSFGCGLFGRCEGCYAPRITKEGIKMCENVKLHNNAAVEKYIESGAGLYWFTWVTSEDPIWVAIESVNLEALTLLVKAGAKTNIETWEYLEQAQKQLKSYQRALLDAKTTNEEKQEILTKINNLKKIIEIIKQRTNIFVRAYCWIKNTL